MWPRAWAKLYAPKRPFGRVARPMPTPCQSGEHVTREEGDRILVAEDDPQTRKVLVDFLEDWGLEVTACADGTSAWEQIRQSPPSLLLLDWAMPGLDGIELCRRIRQLPDRPFVYIIFLTGRGGMRDLAAGLEAGADDYLAKPFEDIELKARIRAGLRLARLWEEKMALEKTRVLMQAAGGMAHDIAQPLSVIMGQAQLLQMRGTADSKAEGRLDAIVDAAQRVDDILRGMEAAQREALKAHQGETPPDAAAGGDGPDPILLV